MNNSKFTFFSSYLVYKNVYSQINLINLFINENNFSNLVSTNDIISHRKFNFMFYRKRRIFNKITRKIKFLRRKLFSRKFTLKFRTNKYFCKFKKPLNNKLKKKYIFYNLSRFNKFNLKINKSKFNRFKDIKFVKYNNNLFKKDNIYKNIVFSKLKNKTYLKTKFNNLNIKSIKNIMKKIFKLKWSKKKIFKRKKYKRKILLQINKFKDFHNNIITLLYCKKKQYKKINLKKNFYNKYYKKKFFFKLKQKKSFKNLKKKKMLKKKKKFINFFKKIKNEKKYKKQYKKNFLLKSLLISNGFLNLRINRNFNFKNFKNILKTKFTNFKKLNLIYKFIKIKKENYISKTKNFVFKNKQKKNFFFFKKKFVLNINNNLHFNKYKLYIILKKRNLKRKVKKKNFKLTKTFFFLKRNYNKAKRKIFVNKRMKSVKRNFFSFSFLISHLSIKKYNYLKKRNEFLKEMKNYDKLVSETPDTQSLTKAYFKEKYVEFKEKYVDLIKDDKIMFLQKKNFVGIKDLNRNDIPFLDKHAYWIFQKNQEQPALKKLGLKCASLFSYKIQNDMKDKMILHKLKKKSVLKNKILTI